MGERLEPMLLHCWGCGRRWMEPGNRRGGCVCRDGDPHYEDWHPVGEHIASWASNNTPDWWAMKGFPGVTAAMCRWLMTLHSMRVAWVFDDLVALDFFMAHPEVWIILGYQEPSAENPHRRRH